jgi:hypothetical protein
MPLAVMRAAFDRDGGGSSSGRSRSKPPKEVSGGAPMVPDSPMPFPPIGLVLQRTSSNAISKFGNMSARGFA